MSSLGLWLVGFGGRAATLALALLNVVVVARALGPEGRGQYFVFVSLIVALSVLADLGISSSAIVFGGRRDRSLADVHRVLAVLAMALALAVALVAGAAILLAGDRLEILQGLPREWSLAATALALPALYANFWTGMMVGARHLVSVNAVQLGGHALALPANLLFVVTTGDPAVAILVYGGMVSLQAATMVVLAIRMTRSRPAVMPAGAQAREMVMFGLRAYPNSLSMLLWTRAAVFVLNGAHGPGAVGTYSVAQQIAERALFPVQAVQDLLYNWMSRLPRQEATAAMNRYLRVTLAAAVPTMGLAILAAPMLVTSLFTESFAEATAPLRVLLVGSAVQTIPVLLAPYFLAQLRRPGMLSILAWSNAALDLALLLVLIPFAETGAAVAMVMAQVIGTCVVFGIYLRLAQTDPTSALILRTEDVATVGRQALGLIHR